MRATWIVGAAAAAFVGLASLAGAGAPAGDDVTKQPQATAPATPAGQGPGFVDADGDGICDNLQAGRPGQGRERRGRRGGWGPGDGSGNQGVGPKDGTGYGPGPGTNCDGTGPKGRRRGPR